MTSSTMRRMVWSRAGWYSAASPRGHSGQDVPVEGCGLLEVHLVTSKRGTIGDQEARNVPL